MIWCGWIKWNAEQVTELVRDIKEMINNTGKDIVLGVDVFRKSVKRAVKATDGK